MAADGFTVDYEHLRLVGSNLAALHQEFSNGTQSIDPLLAAVGHDDLRSELNEFINNWSDKKKTICAHMKQVGDLATFAAKGYGEVDQAYETGFTQQESQA